MHNLLKEVAIYSEENFLDSKYFLDPVKKVKCQMILKGKTHIQV